MLRWLENINGRFAPQRLTVVRMAVALAAAVIVDGLQLVFAELVPVPEILDVLAMIATTAALGFHLLLLPTFVIEMVPLVDIAPTWTGCVCAVIILRKRAEAKAGVRPDGVSEPKKFAPPQS